MYNTVIDEKKRTEQITKYENTDYELSTVYDPSIFTNKIFRVKSTEDQNNENVSNGLKNDTKSPSINTKKEEINTINSNTKVEKNSNEVLCSSLYPTISSEHLRIKIPIAVVEGDFRMEPGNDKNKGRQSETDLTVLEYGTYQVRTCIFQILILIQLFYLLLFSSTYYFSSFFIISFSVEYFLFLFILLNSVLLTVLFLNCHSTLSSPSSPSSLLFTYPPPHFSSHFNFYFFYFNLGILSALILILSHTLFLSRHHLILFLVLVLHLNSFYSLYLFHTPHISFFSLFNYISVL